MSILSRLAITVGEPSGIGPDIVIKLAQQPQAAEIIAIADRELLLERAQLLNLPLQIVDCDLANSPSIHKPGILPVLHIPLKKQCRPQHLDAANASYVLETLRIAGLGCLNNEFTAVVSGPVHTNIIHQAGHNFSGQAEFFTHLSHVEQAVMLLACPGLRVALVTGHLPLASVPKNITAYRLEQTLRILQHDLQFRFDIAAPRILVCGLNPHAGDEGYLGREEIEIIQPVLEKLRSQGFNLLGPIPADIAFTPSYLKQADVILAMYYDQGFTVIKHQGFGQSVNITLGLPIIHTSVDHDAALTLAGTGEASPNSLQSAIQMAIIIAEQGQIKTAADAHA